MRPSSRVLCILAVTLLATVFHPADAANNQRAGLQKPGAIATNQQPSSRLDAPTENTKLVSDSVTDLAARIANALSNQKSKTEIFSPVSIAGALSLLLLGSGGKTQQELLNVMGLNKGQLSFQQIHISFGRLFQDLVSNDPSLEPLVTWRLNDRCNRYDEDEEDEEFEQSQAPSNPNEYPSHQISLANGIFLQRGYKPGARFLQLAQHIYQSTVTDLDFERDSNGAAAYINGWCTKATNGKIQDIVTEDILRNTRMIVANALYFKAQWETTFSPYGTRPRPFYPDGGEQAPAISVDSMATTGCFPYYNASAEYDVQIVGLPYEKGLSTMYIILPNGSNRQKMREKVATLQSAQLNWLIDRMVVRKGRVLIPKLNISNRIRLSSVLQGLGMRDIFDPVRSNLTGILSDKPTEPIIDPSLEPESNRRPPSARPSVLNRVDLSDTAKERPVAQKPTTTIGPARQPETGQRPQGPQQALAPPANNLRRDIFINITAHDCQLIENCQFVANLNRCMCNRIPTNDESSACGAHLAKHYYDSNSRRCPYSINASSLRTFICLKPNYQPESRVNTRDECERISGCKMLLNSCYCCRTDGQTPPQPQYQTTANTQPVRGDVQPTYNAGQTSQRVTVREILTCPRLPQQDGRSCQSAGFTWVASQSLCIDMRTCTTQRLEKRQAPAYYFPTSQAPQVPPRQVQQSYYQVPQQQQQPQTVQYQPQLQQPVQYQLQSRFEQEQQQQTAFQQPAQQVRPQQQYQAQQPPQPQVVLQPQQQLPQQQLQQPPQQILRQPAQQPQQLPVQRQPQQPQLPLQRQPQQPQLPVQRQPQQPQLPVQRQPQQPQQFPPQVQQPPQQLIPQDQRQQPQRSYDSLYANEIITQVTLDVNEQGTEGGAVTAALIDRIGPDYSFVVDRPFLIFIRNDKTRLPLFYGVVYDPRP